MNNPYQNALLYTSLGAFAAMLVFGFLGLINQTTDQYAAAGLLSLAGNALLIGLVFIGLWIAVSALRHDAQAAKEKVSAHFTDADGL